MNHSTKQTCLSFYFSAGIKYELKTLTALFHRPIKDYFCGKFG